MHKDYIHSLLLPKRNIPMLASPQSAEQKLSPWRDLTVAMSRLSVQDLHVEFPATSALNVYTHGSNTKQKTRTFIWASLHTEEINVNSASDKKANKREKGSSSKQH